MDDSLNLKYCPYCMELDNISESGICPHCHRETGDAENAKEDLPIYTVLDSRYMVGNAEEHTEDTNTYIGLDLTEKKKVWVKEFFYRSLVYRSQNSTSIQTYAGQKESYLKKYDTCVREYQKSGGNKKIVFSNGTVYQIIPLSEEEISALCQNSLVSETLLDAKEKAQKEEKSVNSLLGKEAGDSLFSKLRSSKKIKMTVLALLAVCVAGSLLQKYDIGNIIGNERKESESGSTVLRDAETSAPASAVSGEMPEQGTPEPSPGRNISPSPGQTAVPATPKPIPKTATNKKPKAAKHSTPKPSRKPSVTRHSRLKPEEKPAAAGKPKKIKPKAQKTDK